MTFGRLEEDPESTGQPMADINMIPMIDVMLVLLIVFMITAPLLTNAVKLNLPKANSAENKPPPQAVHLALNAKGETFWNNQPCDRDCLEIHMTEIAPRQPQPELQLHIDRQVPYQQVAQLMAQATHHGLDKLAFVSQPDSD